MWLYAFVPVLVAGCGGAFSVIRPPGPLVKSSVQHLAAGVIFAAAAGELLPDAIRHGTIVPVIVGATVGVFAVLILRVLSKAAKGPLSLIGASAVDALIDGLVLGLAFDAGRRQGQLLAVALAVEFLFLAVSVASTFKKNSSPWMILATTLGIAAMVPIGTLSAYPISGAPKFVQTAAYAFGLIALLYLVVEELLVEAHEKPEAPWITALFFVGFVALTILNELMSA